MGVTTRKIAFGIGVVLFAALAIRIGSVTIPDAVVRREWNWVAVWCLFSLIFICLALISLRATAARRMPPDF